MVDRAFRRVAFLCSLVLLGGVATTVSAQVAAGGTYSLEQAVIAGGGQFSTGGTYSIVGTVGQSVAGIRSAEDPYGLDPGFWQTSYLPTAAMVSVTGRVVTQDGRGIVGVRLTLVDPLGNTYQSLSSSFGAFQFDAIGSGQAYVLTVTSKRFQFTPQVLVVNDQIADLKIVAEP